jgi:hypothetical protein
VNDEWRVLVRGWGHSEGGLQFLHGDSESLGGCLEVRGWFAECGRQFLLGYAENIGCCGEIGAIARRWTALAPTVSQRWHLTVARCINNHVGQLERRRVVTFGRCGVAAGHTQRIVVAADGVALGSAP